MEMQCCLLARVLVVAGGFGWRLDARRAVCIWSGRACSVACIGIGVGVQRMGAVESLAPACSGATLCCVGVVVA